MLRVALDFLSGFTRGEYHVIRVDFISSSRGRLERDRGFANPLSLSNTSPDPWGDPLRRGILAAAVDRDIVSLFPVLSLIPTSTWCLGAVCSVLDCSRFSRFRWAYVFRFSLVVDRLFIPAATWRFAMNMRRITADRDIVPILYGASPFHQCCRVQNDRETAFVQLKLQENRHPIQAEPLTIQVIPHRLHNFPYSIGYYNTSFTYRYPPKQTTQSRSAQIQR